MCSLVARFSLTSMGKELIMETSLVTLPAAKNLTV